MHEVEAEAVLDSPVGRWRLTGQDQGLSLGLPREAEALALWRAVRPFRGLVAPLTRSLAAGGLTLRFVWRGQVVGRVASRPGRGPSAATSLRVAPWGLLRALLAGRGGPTT